MILETLERWGRQEDRRAREAGYHTGLAGKQSITQRTLNREPRKACVEMREARETEHEGLQCVRADVWR